MVTASRGSASASKDSQEKIVLSKGTVSTIATRGGSASRESVYVISAMKVIILINNV